MQRYRAIKVNFIGAPAVEEDALLDAIGGIHAHGDGVAVAVGGLRVDSEKGKQSGGEGKGLHGAVS